MDMCMLQHGCLRTGDTCSWGLNSGLLAWHRPLYQLAITLTPTQLKCVKNLASELLNGDDASVVRVS